ncbi:chitotriosidase-1-like isoform X2 [Homarus americanus]|uniref:chitotriosidase-1-like isoform X2 n=1 Tax=Homarus americanus TaxID=6706 RepID=UPI001C4720DF|nr:chitotriosidase-1-like isoform X2 [Homarus americanus]
MSLLPSGSPHFLSLLLFFLLFFFFFPVTSGDVQGQSSQEDFSASSGQRLQEELQDEDDDFVVVCYYGSWAVYRPGQGKFDVENIDPHLCTHLIYGFAGLRQSNNTIVSLDPYNDLYDNYGKGAYKRFTRLKEINTDLKTLLAIGGWNEGSTKYSQMVSSKSTRSTFIESCVEFLHKYGFDGLDIDWEYPTQRGGRPEDKVNFGHLLDEMRSEFNKHDLLMTSAVSAGKITIDLAYDVAALARNLDLVNLMGYDLHGSWEHYAHHHSPLYAHPLDKGMNALLNVDWAVRYWISIGLPPKKLVMGMGLYGRCYTLARADEHDVYSPAYQPGLPGPYTREAGVLGYNEICEEQLRQKWTVVREKHMVSPYAYHDRQWCGYDDVKSLTVKALYIKEKGLGGGMVWSIETDDFHGLCHQHNDTFPLITTIHTILRDGPPAPTPTPEPETTTVEGEWEEWLFHCPPGTVFVEDLQNCDFPENHPACRLLPPITLPTTTQPDTTLPPTTLPPTTLPPDTTLPPTTLPDTTLPPTTLPDTTLPPPTTLPPISQLNSSPDIPDTENDLANVFSDSYGYQAFIVRGGAGRRTQHLHTARNEITAVTRPRETPAGTTQALIQRPATAEGQESASQPSDTDSLQPPKTAPGSGYAYPFLAYRQYPETDPGTRHTQHPSQTYRQPQETTKSTTLDDVEHKKLKKKQKWLKAYKFFSEKSNKLFFQKAEKRNK